VAGDVLSRISRRDIEERLEVVRCKAGDGNCRERNAAASADGAFSDGWGAFVAFEYENMDRDTTNREAGFDSDTYGVTGGLDKMLTDYLVMGVAFSYMSADGDFDVSGDFEDDEYSGYVYASVFPTDQTYVDLVLGYTFGDSEINRPFIVDQGGGLVHIDTNGDGTGSPIFFVGEPDTNEYTIDLKGGYDFVFDGVTVGPRLGLNYTRTEIDDYSESGAAGGANGQLAFDDQDIDSFQSRVGAQAIFPISTGVGVIVPQIGVDWVHEFENDSRNVDATFLAAPNPTITYKTDDPDRDWVELAAGASLVIPGGYAFFANYSGQFLNSLEESHAVTVGLRMELGGP
jgi:uncharacterized protein YhjY with autotransporter beta-barrel domain